MNAPVNNEITTCTSWACRGSGVGSVKVAFTSASVRVLHATPPRAVCECLETYSAGLCGAICDNVSSFRSLPGYTQSSEETSSHPQRNSDGLRFMIRSTPPTSHSKVSGTGVLFRRNATLLRWRQVFPVLHRAEEDEETKRR